jgi:hypothetical protein
MKFDDPLQAHLRAIWSFFVACDGKDRMDVNKLNSNVLIVIQPQNALAA